MLGANHQARPGFVGTAAHRVVHDGQRPVLRATGGPNGGGRQKRTLVSATTDTDATGFAPRRDRISAHHRIEWKQVGHETLDQYHHREFLMPAHPHDTPSDINAEGGEVHIDGPGGTALAMTPRAALETSDRLIEGATKAAGQNAMKRARDQQP